jgi:hypothetical protein
MVDTTCRDDAGLDVDEGVPPPGLPPVDGTTVTARTVTAATVTATATAAAPRHRTPSATRDGADVRRNAVIGATTGFLVTAVAVAVGCALGGMAATSALGLGVFVGGWGGAAFGFMLASAISLAGHTEPRPVPPLDAPA